MRKEVINKAFHMGYKAFPTLPCVPHKNNEFMKMVPNFLFSDEEGRKLKEKMYKQYIKGWAKAFIEKVWKD